MAIGLAGIHPQLRPYAEYALKVAQLNKIPVELTSTYRSRQQQIALRNNYELCLARGVAGQAVQLTPGMSCSWPANKPGDSAHEYGLAWDSVVPAEFQDAWDYIRRAIGWSVPENDRIHAELPSWRSYLV